MSLSTLLGVVLGPVAGLYLADKMINDGSKAGVAQDTVNQALNKTAGVNGALALGSYFLSGVGSPHLAGFAEGAMLSTGVTAGLALGARAVTSAHAGQQPAAGALMQGQAPAQMGAYYVPVSVPSSWGRGHPAQGAKQYAYEPVRRFW